ncbi:hypothetical protein ACO0LD_17975 [Undibacterium sp. Ji83W]|uniref:hypothetical protein n=1 Tax=Undibacterium sp. Ji83W TaxID=3413043 RepID=UPI003BF06F14
MSLIQIAYQAPNNGWLALTLTLDGKIIEIDASDVPNNPIQELIAALEDVVRGLDSSVWWHLEPAGYLMYFERVSEEVRLRIDYSNNSKRSHAKEVAVIQGSPAQILKPFWRFLREFQSHSFNEPHWPYVDYQRLPEIKLLLDADSKM